MLYHSINDNWKFNYRIILIHSMPLKLSKLDINILQRNIDGYPYMIRRIAYVELMDCDYGLILDSDVIFPNIQYWRRRSKKLGYNYTKKYHNAEINEYLFPYFNNGAIFIKTL